MARTYVLECPPDCSLGPNTVYGIKCTEAMLEGQTYRSIVAMAAAEGVKLFPGTISRHKKHIVVTGRKDDERTEIAHKANNIEILETIIQKGFQNQRNWKPTISDTMKAMDMWFRLTQGNPFDDLLNTLAAASLGETEVEETNPQAVHAVGEQLDVTDVFADEEEPVATAG